MKKTIAAAAVLAALALTGCSAGNQSADVAPSATATPSASPTTAPAISSPSPGATESKKVDAGQAWANDMINLYLASNGAKSFKGFSEGSPDREIKEWKSPENGVLSITVGGEWSTEDHKYLSLRILDMIQADAEDLDAVRVGTPGKAKEVECYASENRNLNATECTI